jgi:hypothetical protein
VLLPPSSIAKWKFQARREFHMKLLRFIPLLFVVAGLGVLAPVEKAQSIGDARTSSSSVADASRAPAPAIKYPQPDLLYKRPTEKTKLRAYLFDAFGPYPIFGAAVVAGVNQAEGTPPEWGQGASGYGQRFGSNLAIAAVTTTTRYSLAEAFREDTVYYRCECQGLFRRLRHAMISTVTARRGEEGHRQLSLPAIVAPYAGTMTAVYGWYPSRYGPEDALRMGNYNLLAFMGENLALEFIYGGPHTLFSHVHRPPISGTDSSSASNR